MKVVVELGNCYGIKALNETFDFTEQRVYSIYAPNGFMKTSFSRTMNDLSKGEDSRDVIFPDRVTSRMVKDGDGNDITPEQLLVIEPYNPDFYSDKASMLLVNQGLKEQYDKGSILVEVKTSRSDFLADKNKAHRSEDYLGVGNFRYYLAPAGLISTNELPNKWGLIEVHGKRRLKVVSGFHVKDNQLSAQDWCFSSVNTEGELFLLIRALSNTEPQKFLDRERKNNLIIRNYEQFVANLAGMLLTNQSSYEVENKIKSLLHEIECLKKENEMLNLHNHILQQQINDYKSKYVPRIDE